MTEPIRFRHAIGPPEWWCEGEFGPTPIRIVGVGHAAPRAGFPVFRCRKCGDEAFLPGNWRNAYADREAA